MSGGDQRSGDRDKGKDPKPLIPRSPLTFVLHTASMKEVQVGLSMTLMGGRGEKVQGKSDLAMFNARGKFLESMLRLPGGTESSPARRLVILKSLPESLTRYQDLRIRWVYPLSFSS
jgi:hypothetical protein